MRTFALLMMIAACSAEKPAPVAPDFGDDDAKLDSARAPASFTAIPLNQTANARFTGKSQFRAFHFDGQKGQMVSIYLDGLDGLDTVAYLYKATSSKPSGSPLASNDDTSDSRWTQNVFSSSIVDYVLPDTRSYALVATTYFGDAGEAQVTINAVQPLCSGSVCGDGTFCEQAASACGVKDLTGSCQPKPQFCIEIYKPVCGCDGQTYGNDCVRQGNGISLAHFGPCK